MAKQSITVLIDPSVREELQAIAAQQELAFSDVVRAALREYLQKKSS